MAEDGPEEVWANQRFGDWKASSRRGGASDRAAAVRRVEHTDSAVRANRWRRAELLMAPAEVAARGRAAWETRQHRGRVRLRPCRVRLVCVVVWISQLTRTSGLAPAERVGKKPFKLLHKHHHHTAADLQIHAAHTQLHPGGQRRATREERGCGEKGTERVTSVGGRWDEGRGEGGGCLSGSIGLGSPQSEVGVVQSVVSSARRRCEVGAAAVLTRKRSASVYYAGEAGPRERV